jgi:hypothetical protein
MPPSSQSRRPESGFLPVWSPEQLGLRRTQVPTYRTDMMLASRAIFAQNLVPCLTVFGKLEIEYSVVCVCVYQNVTF